MIIDSPRRREQLAAVAERLPAHVARLEWSQDQIKAERQLLAVIEAGQIVHGSPFLFSVSTDPEAEVKWIPADTPLDALVASLNEARPTQINCFGSVMGELAAEVYAVNVTAPLRCSGSPPGGRDALISWRK